MDADQASSESPAPAGLRERKAAGTRLAIAKALDRALRKTSLAEIRVEDLAAEANVSRMTFFNYFPTKEHALDFVVAMFMFEVQADLARERLRGVAAIEHVFAAFGESVAEHPERMRRIQAYLASRPADRHLPELGRVERASIAPDVDALELDEVDSLGAMFMRAIDEAKRAREISFEGTTYELAHYLGALAVGGTLIGHSSAETDFRRLFRRHVRRALGLPLGGRRGSVAPVTPERWKKNGKKGEGRR